MKKVIDDNVNQSYVSVANYLMKNNELDFNNLTIFKLAKLTNTSAPTITRFCRSMGIDGFKELQFLLKDEGHEILRKVDSELLISENDKRGELFTQNVINSVRNGFDMNNQKFEKMALEIKKAKRIYFFGLGSNAILIKLISDLLVRMNFNVVFSKNTEQQMAYASNITKEDFVCIVSVSLSDPIFEWLLDKPNLKEIEPFFITKRTSAKVLEKVDPLNIIEIGTSDNQLGIRFSSEISTIFILKMILIYLIDENLANFLNRSEI
ncbi:MurR/RpiR family transcriptional regulator [Spiroplasma alleghenense]|uniref:RpiR family transcriptional regulator n=1 Tax=Spiroplasma alleghenense TaxID=216931 RepID=A0A345Z4X7_9MOLU|nr:MurR/RpiR family transcriptional regulator [Spiroplasma alleghenense]AXK51656.1 RpiR family transcriptional regulator [Spiroplasma alleghenense]